MSMCMNVKVLNMGEHIFVKCKHAYTSIKNIYIRHACICALDVYIYLAAIACFHVLLSLL